MAEEASSKAAQPPLVDRILQCGKLAFDPTLSENTRQSSQRAFVELIESTSTIALLPVLNLLVQPERVHSWLRAPIIYALARLPLRNGGVQHTIEFILSVHPTSSGANAEASTGRGAAISHDALNAASRLLSSPPAGMTPEDWFQGIAPQLFSLLQGKGELDMDKAAAFIIGFGILGRRQYGAPGMPGWKAFVEPIFKCLDPTLDPHALVNDTSKSVTEQPIITLGNGKILAPGVDVARALQRLSTLLASHPNPALTKRLLQPIFLPLWTLSHWPLGNDYTKRCYHIPARDLLKTLLQLSTGSGPSKEQAQLPNSNIITDIFNNILFNGRYDPKYICWEFSMADDGGIQILEISRDQVEIGKGGDLRRIDSSVDAFIALIGAIPDLTAEISMLFLQLFTKWISYSGDNRKAPIVAHFEPSDGREDFESRFVEVKIMQKMMTAFPDKLVHNTTQVLQVSAQVLSDFAANDDSNEDTAAVALSLLNIVLTSPNFQPTPQNDPVLGLIQTSLQSISKKIQLEVSTTAENLLQLLRFRTTIEEPNANRTTTLTDQQLEHRKKFSLAMSYLTAIDSPPPVRAQGLELISELIRINSSVLDIPALLVLFASLLQDNEEYIYLRVVKSFIQLSQSHPKAVMKDIVDRYIDPNEEAELDQRLRLGEALQVIQNSPHAFKNDTARSVCEGLLFVASRRGYRPKTELEQEKKDKLKRKQDKEAEEAWDGPVPQMDEDPEMESKEDREILSQIVGGWESKRGVEDARIRASALSILGSAIVANVTGITSSLISSAVDLSIHILTLEPEPEKGILRRAAILLIMSFIKALDTARQEGQQLRFGLVGQSSEDIQRILKYVEGSDNDGLVRQHARDVIESLQAWQMNALIPLQKEQTEIQELAGLSINPRLERDSQGKMRPRIEEIE